ncbi:hypothetical protein BH24ACT3_BH24ACT3_00520 [soil metagenome]
MEDMDFEAVLFDAGGVLVRPGDDGAIDSWAAAHRMTRAEVLSHQRAAIGPGWEGGRTIAEIHTRLARNCGIGPDELPQLLATLHDEVLSQPMATFAGVLRPRFRTGIVMNNGGDARQMVCERLGLDHIVDRIVISAEERVSKPDPRIYLTAAARLGVAPHRCLFVDDSPACVEGARAVGMTAIRFESADQALHDLRHQLDVVEHDYDAAGGVVLDGDQVLVLERSSRNEIRLPKGHVEEGETDHQAAVREVAEEAGYGDVEIECDLGIQHVEFDAFPPDGPGHHVVRRERYFRMRLRSDHQVKRSTGDHKFTPRWVPMADAPNLMTFDVEREWVRRARGSGLR